MTRSSASILLIVLDTLRADRLGPYGGSPDRMPKLTRWAAGATVFRNATTVAPFTMPSVAALLTGDYPDRAGINVHASGVTLRAYPGDTLAELAGKSGRKTGAVVSNPWLARRSTGFERGFDLYAARNEGSAPLERADAAGVTDAAVAMLDRFDDSPFFLWVHYFDPHMPYRPPAEHARAAGAGDGASRVMDDFAADGRDLTRIYRAQGYEAADIEQAGRLYDGELAYLDEQVARLLEHLEDTGRADDTIVIVASDHGEAFGEHGLYFAHDYTLYEELLATVLMMRGPGLPAAVRDEPVSLIDVVPTLCRMLELGCRDRTDGVALFGDDSALISRTLFAAATPYRERAARFDRLRVQGIDGRWTMARRGSLKLIKIPRRKREPRLELFDLAGDPRELDDLYAGVQGEPRHDLRTALEKWEKTMRAARPRAAPPPASPEEERTLRSLGYLQ